MKLYSCPILSLQCITELQITHTEENSLLRMFNIDINIKESVIKRTTEQLDEKDPDQTVKREKPSVLALAIIIRELNVTDGLVDVDVVDNSMDQT